MQETHPEPDHMEDITEYVDDTPVRDRVIGPVTKTTTAAGSIPSAIVALGLWLLHEFAGIEVPGEVGAALVIIVGAIGNLIGGWSVKPPIGQ